MMIRGCMYLYGTEKWASTTKWIRIAQNHPKEKEVQKCCILYMYVYACVFFFAQRYIIDVWLKRHSFDQFNGVQREDPHTQRQQQQ